MSNTSFDGSFFQDNPDILKVLPYLTDIDEMGDTQDTGNILEADILKDGLTALNTIVDLDAFLSSYEDGSGNIQGFPDSLDEFATALASFGGAAKADILNVFRETYLAHLGLNASGNPTTFPSTNSPTNEIEGQELVGTLGMSLTELTQQADNFFDDFFANYPFHVDATTGQQTLGYSGATGSGNEVGGNSFHHFLSTFTRAFQRIATFDSTEYRDDLVFLTSQHYIDSQTALSQYDVDYPTFRNVFNAFVSNDPDDYEEALLAFYQEVLGKTGHGDPDAGYFVPSLAFEGWVRTVYTLSNMVPAVESLSNEASKRTIVLDRIMKLIISMIEVIQQISIAQAERLTFLSKWQKAYTETINSIPIASQGDRFSFSETQRNQFNTKANRMIEIVRARRQVVVDDAKSHQSAVNQSSDAVTQQVNIGTAILDQLGSLISAIFR